MKLEVLGSERIRVPAGEFMAIKVEGVTNTYKNTYASQSLKLTYWYAPQVKRTVRLIREMRSDHLASRQEEIYELASYKLKE